MYSCKKCGKFFNNVYSLGGHVSSHNRKKKTKELKRHQCKFCNKEFDNGLKLGGHVVRCKLNPNTKLILQGISQKAKGRKLSINAKEKVSEGMKKAHSEGRAWNIGKSRWNNQPSYPEKFFRRVIENEIDDKNYRTEYNVGIYSIDFAWVNRMLAFEVDGEQHEKPEYKERDQRKDKFLQERGWKILRLKWKEVSNNPKEEIQKLKNFVNENYENK